MNPEQQEHSAAPGKVMISVLLYGALGVILSAVLYRVGLLGKVDQRIFNLLHEPVFQNGAPLKLAFSGLLLVTAILCFAIAYAVLDTRGMWRRVVLGLTLLVLIIGVVPTLAVWDFYFPPTMILVGVFWTWFACLVYSNHHHMPCDDGVGLISQPITQQVAVAAQAVTQSQVAELAPLPVNVDEEAKLSAVKDLIQEFTRHESEEENIEPDPDAKYKPKD